MADPAGLEGALAALPEAKRELARLMLAARRPVPAHPAPRSGAGPVPRPHSSPGCGAANAPTRPSPPARTPCG